MAEGDAPILFEAAWEVCNKVGGIYTVLRSKAKTASAEWGDDYFLVGPYVADTAAVELEERTPPPLLQNALAILQSRGLKVHYGIWLVTGRPQVLLFDLDSIRHRLAEIKFVVWEKDGISLPGGDPMVDDVVCFGHMLELFFCEFCREHGEQRRLLLHVHEWLAGSHISALRRHDLPLGITFTTHATLLGRYLAQNDPWFYDHLPFVDWEVDAKRYLIEAQVRLERAAAHGAHVFSTVSDITAFECEHLLGRVPDLLLPNGLNIERFVALHEFQNLHRLYKEEIHNFAMGHFFPSYAFDLDKTLYFFSSGRYEFRNKGFDLTFDALARLNWKLKVSGTDRTIVFFLITRRPYQSINPESLRNRALLEEMRRGIEDIKRQLGERLFLSIAMGDYPKLDDLVDDNLRFRLRQMRHSWRTERLPSIVTHNLDDDQNDDVLNKLRACNLLNWPDDPVKVIYHPEFVSASDPLLAMDYDNFVRGCHLGIFPSAYEPWGYTPLECVARGVPAVTSDLAGFGTYLMHENIGQSANGLLVVRRRYESYDNAVNQLTDWLMEFITLERRGRIALRNRVESMADHFDWDNLYRHYDNAYRLVLERLAG